MLAKIACGLILFVPITSAAEPKSEDVSRVKLVDRDGSGRGRPARADARKPGEWIELSDATPAKHGSEHISVDPSVGALTQLRVEATGTVILRRIKVYFGDGSEKTLRVDTTLSAKHPTATVDIKRDLPIARLVVDTARTSGSYTVHGIAAKPSTGMAKR